MAGPGRRTDSISCYSCLRATQHGSQPTHEDIVRTRGQLARSLDYDRSTELAPTPVDVGMFVERFPEHDAATASSLPEQTEPQPTVYQPYANTVGRDTTAFETRQPNSNGRGLVFLLSNSMDRVPGFAQNIDTLEHVYIGNHLSADYIVLGGSNHPERDTFRDITMPHFTDLCRRLNHHYSPDMRLNGAEFDRILLHLFGPGNHEYIKMADGYVRRVDLINLLANDTPNTERQIPIVLHTHTNSAPWNDLPPAFNPEYPPTPLNQSPNILGVGTHDDPPPPGVNLERYHTKTIRRLAKYLKQSGKVDVKQALREANDEAIEEGGSCFQLMENGFKVLKL